MRHPFITGLFLMKDPASRRELLATLSTMVNDPRLPGVDIDPSLRGRSWEALKNVIIGLSVLLVALLKFKVDVATLIAQISELYNISTSRLSGDVRDGGWGSEGDIESQKLDEGRAKIAVQAEQGLQTVQNFKNLMFKLPVIVKAIPTFSEARKTLDKKKAATVSATMNDAASLAMSYALMVAQFTEIVSALTPLSLFLGLTPDQHQILYGVPSKPLMTLSQSFTLYVNDFISVMRSVNAKGLNFAFSVSSDPHVLAEAHTIPIILKNLANSRIEVCLPISHASIMSRVMDHVKKSVDMEGNLLNTVVDHDPLINISKLGKALVDSIGKSELLLPTLSAEVTLPNGLKVRDESKAVYAGDTRGGSDLADYEGWAFLASLIPAALKLGGTLLSKVAPKFVASVSSTIGKVMDKTGLGALMGSTAGKLVTTVAQGAAINEAANQFSAITGHGASSSPSYSSLQNSSSPGSSDGMSSGSGSGSSNYPSSPDWPLFAIPDPESQGQRFDPVVPDNNDDKHNGPVNPVDPDPSPLNFGRILTFEIGR